MSKARSVGFSPARLKRIDAFIEQRYLEPGRFPGALTLIARGGKIAHLSVQGLADVERKTPLAEETIFRIYSMTKPITSVAFMMLVEEGAVALDDPVEKFIPAWRDLGVFVAGGPGHVPDPPAGPADAGRRPSPPHQRPHLRLSEPDQRRRRLPKGRDRRDGRQARPCGDDQGPRRPPAGILAGRGVELFGFHRCPGLSHRDDQRTVLRRFPSRADLRAARHVRHRFPRPGRKSRSAGGLLQQGRGRPTEAAGRSGQEPLPRRRRLSIQAAAAWFRPPRTISPSAGCCSAGGQAAGERLLEPQDHRADDRQPPSGRERSHPTLALAVQRGDQRRHRLWPRLRGQPRSGQGPAAGEPRASTIGAERPAPPSGSIRPKT